MTVLKSFPISGQTELLRRRDIKTRKSWCHSSGHHLPCGSCHKREVLGGSHHARLVGNRGAPGRFCIYNKAVLEQEGKKSSHLLLKLVENDLCLI